VWLVAAISRRLGIADPGVAALLFASCPLFTLLQTSLQSQVFTLPAALAGYLALLHARAGGGHVFGAGLALGACAGWIFLARPLTGLVFAAAMTPGLWLRGGERPAPGLRALSGALLGGLPFLVALLAYDRALTGSAGLTPYALYAAEFSPWDVYPLFRSAFFEDPWTAVLQNLSRQLVRWAPALFGVLGAAGLGFWGLWRLRARDGGAGLAFSVALPLAYALHWYPGHWAMLGPIYAAESLGLLVVAALLLLDAAPPGWHRSLPPIALAAGTALFVQRFELVEEQARLRFAPEAVVAAMKLEREAVVLLPRYHQPDRHERALNLYTPTRPPLTAPVVYLRQFDSVARTRAAIEAFGLADRAVYRFVPDDSGLGGRLEPFEP
jgi:hypothetical protein